MISLRRITRPNTYPFEGLPGVGSFACATVPEYHPKAVFVIGG